MKASACGWISVTVPGANAPSSGGRSSVGRSLPDEAAVAVERHAALEPVARHRSASSCTGIASSTSLPTTTPRCASGSRSSHCTRVAEARQRCAGARAARRTGRRWCSAQPARPSASSSCAASAPEPAPNSQHLVGCRWPPAPAPPARASARPNSGDSSGAVTKSLPDAGHQRRTGGCGVGVVAQARRVQRQRHEAVERQPAARRRRWPARIAPLQCGSIHCRALLVAPDHRAHCRNHATPRPPGSCSSPARRKRARPRDRARAGRARLARGGALPALGAPRPHDTVQRDARTLARAPQRFRRRPGRRSRSARAAAARGAAHSAASTRWSTTPRCSSTTTRRASAMRRWKRHWRSNTGRADRAGAGAARASHAWRSWRRRRGCVVNLLDQKLWNPNPDYLSYTLSKAALRSRHTAAGAGAGAARAGVRRGARPDAGPAALIDAERVRSAHRMTPLGRSSTPDDVAAAVRFVLENPSITGTTLLVDGGQHLIRAAARRDVPACAQPCRPKPP